PGSRVAGKTLLHEYLRWKPKYIPTVERPIYNEEHAQWLLRNRGLEEYKSYLSSLSEPEPENNLPKLQIFENCPLLINAIKACSYDKPRNNKPAEDVAEFEGDDPYDDIRYVVDAAESFFNDAQNEMVKVQKQDELIQRLEQTGDWTA